LLILLVKITSFRVHLPRVPVSTSPFTSLFTLPENEWVRYERHINTDNYCLCRRGSNPWPADSKSKWSSQLTYRQVCKTIWNDIWSGKKQEIMWRHNTQRHLGQSEENWVYCWLRAHAMFDVTSFPAILSGIRLYIKFCWYLNWLGYLLANTHWLRHKKTSIHSQYHNVKMARMIKPTLAPHTRAKCIRGSRSLTTCFTRASSFWKVGEIELGCGRLPKPWNHAYVII